MATKTTEEIVRETFNDELRYRERKRLLFFGLPWTFTVYSMTDTVLTTKRGLLNTTEDDCYMYKIQDVQLTRSLPERIFGLGTVVCHTGDPTDPKLTLVHIKNYKEIKSFLLKASEAARIKRRTLNVQDIGAEDLEESEAFIDE